MTNQDRLIDNINKLFHATRVRVMNMVSRARVLRVNDTKPRQYLQLEVLKNEVRSGVERVQNYGMTSVPRANAEAAVVAVSGDRGHLLAVAVEDRSCRPMGLEEGDVCVYDCRGTRITLKAGGVVEVTANEIRLGAGATEFVALSNLVLNELNAIRALVGSHTHTVGGTCDPAHGTIAGSAAPAGGGGTAGAVAATKAKAI